jgi:hypothetical protein
LEIVRFFFAAPAAFLMFLRAAAFCFVVAIPGERGNGSMWTRSDAASE